MNNGKTKGRAHRLPPCPAYDVEAMEAWLTRLGERGLFLEKDGFFAGVASFARGEPRRVKYRLEAAQKSTSMWAEDGGEPDPEQIALGEKYAWEYVAKRGDFYIYRSFDMEARELNTDPEVQALALNGAKKRQRGSALYLLFWVVAYPLLFLRGGFLLTAIHTKTWLFLLTVLLALWFVAEEVFALLSLHRLQKRLRREGALQGNKDWRRGAASYHGKRIAKLILALVLLFVFLGRWNDSILGADKLSIGDYTGSLPFPTMADFVQSEVRDYRETMTGMSMGINTIREWSDLLAPRCIEYNEHADIRLANGSFLGGGYYADYYEARSPAIAEQLARELYRMEKRRDDFEPMEDFAVPGDYDLAYGYRSALHFPSVILQKGNRVIRAYFYQTSAGDTVPFETWASMVAGCLAGE